MDTTRPAPKSRDLEPQWLLSCYFATMPLRGPFSLVLRGENLANVTVVTRNSGGTVDIGTPRTVWAGVRVGL